MLRILRPVLLLTLALAAANAPCVAECLGTHCGIVNLPRIFAASPTAGQIDRTGIATTSSTCIASLTTNGSPYFTPIWLP
jgi:hypothetical protein